MSHQNIFNNYSKIQKELPTRAKGINLIMYPIALEAWRRGIELRFYSVFFRDQLRIHYSLKNETHQYKFQLSFGGVMEKESRKIVNSKELTKNYLEAADVPVPKGKTLNIEKDFNEIFIYASSIKYPVVVKPLNAKNATGVFTNLENEDELKTALITLRDDFGYTEIMLEQYIEGEDARVYVIEDQVIAAYKRNPANVIGDGISNIKDLIREKNGIREKNPHLKKFKIEINDKLLEYIYKNGKFLDSIPKENERVFLNSSTLHPDGCETVDITENLSEKMKSIAINAVKALPGMKISGIDIMIDQKRDEGFVLELNASPNISGHIFPMEGQVRDVPKAFIDHHFPETRKKSIEKYKHFTFDFDSIIKQLRDGSVKEVVVPMLPAEKLTSRQFMLSGEINGLISWIHRKAVGNGLGGEFISLSNNHISVKVAGKDDKIESFTQSLKRKISVKTKVKINEDWTGVYSYYFKPITDTKSKDNSQVRKLQDENEALAQELRNIKEKYSEKYQEQEDENRILREEVQNIKNSRSWKLTQPLRKIKGRTIRKS